RIERTAQVYNYRLFSIFDKGGNGLELYFRGNHLNAQIVAAAKKVQSSTMNFFFHTSRWYFICITHSKKMFGYSDLALYVDGELRQTVEFKYPSITSKASFAHIGTN